MGRATSAALNYQLTNFATGKYNEMMKAEALALAERICPTVNVPGMTGQYKEFNDINAFQLYNTGRAMGGDPTRIGFSAGDNTYSCKPQALEVTVDELEADYVGSAGGAIGSQLLAEGKIGALLGAAARSHLNDVLNYVSTQTTAGAIAMDLTNPALDPIAILDAQLDALSLAVGSTSNINIELDVTAWRVIRSHPKVLSRIVGIQVNYITVEQLKSILLFPCNVNVVNIVYHSTKLGQATQTKARFLSSLIYIYFSIPTPSVFDVSAFKNFTVGMGTPVAAVRSWTAPNGLYEGHFVDWSRDIKQTSTVAIKRLNLTLPA